MKDPFKLALGLTLLLVIAGGAMMLKGTNAPQVKTASTAQTGDEAQHPEHGSGAIQWQAFDKGLAQAAAEKKLVMVEFFATWCGYCKKMDEQVFPDERVQAQLSKYFVPVRVTESSENQVTFQGKPVTEKALTPQFGVTGFPTLAFLDAEGELITKIPGFVEADTLQGILQFIGTGAYEKMDYPTFQKEHLAS